MEHLSRREFIKSGALVTSGISLLPESLTLLKKGRAIGANDRIRIGIIGCGSRGNNVFMDGVYKHVGEMNIEIVALCDPWRVAREEANLKVKEWFGRDAKQFVSYREMLEWDNLGSDGPGRETRIY